MKRRHDVGNVSLEINFKRGKFNIHARPSMYWPYYTSRVISRALNNVCLFELKFSDDIQRLLSLNSLLLKESFNGYNKRQVIAVSGGNDECSFLITLQPYAMNRYHDERESF